LRIKLICQLGKNPQKIFIDSQILFFFSNFSAANAFAGACEYIFNRRFGKHIDVSRLFIYYNGQMIDQRSLEVTDDGASKQNTVLGMRKFGVCEERLWPYREDLLNKEPPPNVYEAASRVTVIPLKLPRNLVAMKTCLANEVPFLIGIKLLDSATSEVEKNKGYISMPNPASLKVATTGTHAVLIVGYDDRTGHFLVRNSWGKDWVKGKLKLFRNFFLFSYRVWLVIFIFHTIIY
jgi:C1A family cysteine protease